jgi:hypothetical protein
MTERKVEYRAKEARICPLMSRADVGTYCIGERCALWDGDCAIVVIAKCLRGPVAVFKDEGGEEHGIRLGEG